MIPVDIKEKNIKRIILKDGDAENTYMKYSKKDTDYHVRYKYTDEYAPYGYCDRCGKVYKNPEDLCECRGLDDETADYKMIPDIIYHSLKDGVAVDVILWDDTTYSFDLKEISLNEEE